MRLVEFIRFFVPRFNLCASLSLILFLSLLLCACGGHNATRQDPHALRGILVTDFHTNANRAVLSLVKKDGSELPAAEFIVGAKDNFRIVKLAPGYYTWREIHVGKHARSIRDQFDFKIDGGKINYIGDMLLKVNGDKLQIDFISKASSVKRRLQQDYKKLFNKYPYVVNLTQRQDD